MKLTRAARVVGLTAGGAARLTAGVLAALVALALTPACDCVCGPTAPRGGLFGSVLYADDGTIVAGARIEARLAGPGSSDLGGEPTVVQVTQSDAAGGFELGGLPSSDLEIVATDTRGRSGFVRLAATRVPDRLEVVIHVRAP